MNKNKNYMREIKFLENDLATSKRARQRNLNYTVASIIWYLVFSLGGSMVPDSIDIRYIEFAKSIFGASMFVFLVLYISAINETKEMQAKLNKYMPLESFKNMSFTAEEALKANETDIILVSKKADMLYNDIISQIKEAASSNTKLLLVGWSVRQYHRGHRVVDIADSDLMRSEIDAVVNMLLENNFSLLISDEDIKKSDWSYEREAIYKKVEIAWGAEYTSGIITSLAL